MWSKLGKDIRGTELDSKKETQRGFVMKGLVSCRRKEPFPGLSRCLNEQEITAVKKEAFPIPFADEF